MTFHNILLVIALIAFALAAIGFAFRKLDWIAIGLAVWSFALLITQLNGAFSLSTILLLLAFIAFVAAAIGFRYRKLNLIAIGLALWVLSVIV